MWENLPGLSELGDQGRRMLRFITKPEPTDFYWFIQLILENINSNVLRSAYQPASSLKNIFHKFAYILNQIQIYPVNFSHPYGLNMPFNYPYAYFDSDFLNDILPELDILGESQNEEQFQIDRAIEDTRREFEFNNRAQGFEWETEGQGSSRQAIEDNPNNESYTGKGKGKAK